MLPGLRVETHPCGPVSPPRIPEQYWRDFHRDAPQDIHSGAQLSDLVNIPFVSLLCLDITPLSYAGDQVQFGRITGVALMTRSKRYQVVEFPDHQPVILSDFSSLEADA